MGFRKLDIDEDLLITLYVDKNMSISECADYFNVSESPIMRRLKLNKITRRPRGVPRESQIFTRQKVLEDFKAVHGNRYDYSLFSYEGSTSKGRFICQIHGEFLMVNYDHKRGKGCPECGLLRISGENHYNWNPDREQVAFNHFWKHRIKNMLSSTLRRIKVEKTTSTEEMLGYSSSKLIEHLKTHPNWNPKWDILDRGHEWHVDHIKPVVKFLEEGITEVSIICSLENLQPLSAEENRKKNDRYLTDDDYVDMEEIS